MIGDRHLFSDYAVSTGEEELTAAGWRLEPGKPGYTASDRRYTKDGAEVEIKFSNQLPSLEPEIEEMVTPVATAPDDTTGYIHISVRAASKE